MKKKNQKRLLFVDDEERQRSEKSEYLTRRGWLVDTAEDGDKALEKLKNNTYDVMLLDYQLKRMWGDALLENLKENNIDKPPTIVFSGVLNDEIREKFRYLGVKHILEKPYELPNLIQIIKLIASEIPIGNTPVSYNTTTIDYMVKKREAALKHHLDLVVTQVTPEHSYNEPVFIVGRRWNSWYPSVFSVPGGAYAIVAPKAAAGNNRYEADSTPSIVVDPGFRFMEIFKESGISIANLGCCYVTHDHPDHIGGIFEFTAARHALGGKTRVFANPSSSQILSNFVGFNMEVKQLNNEYVDAIYPYKAEAAWVQIRSRGFNTFHEEAGEQNSSKGLIFTVRTGDSNTHMEDVANVVIVGDTEYNTANHYNAIIPTICSHNTKLITLHIGCSQFKQSTGKHLYITGLNKILRDIDTELQKISYSGKLLVIVSEWGLEHATSAQLKAECGFTLKEFNDVSPIWELVHAIQKPLEKIVLLPADIGLTIGMQTGLVYLPDGSSKKAQDVVFGITAQGIKYK